MRYVFFGTPRFAAIILERLIEAGFIPAAVVCNPDKPFGRKHIMTPPAVKLLIARLQDRKIADYKIRVLQPESLKNQNPAFGGDFGKFQNNPMNLGLVPDPRIADDNFLSNNDGDKSKSRGPAENRTPETQVPTLSSDHPRPTTNLLYQDYDFFVVAAYGKIIPAEVLKIPKLGTIGVHPSLLPKYRGSTPIQSVILNGEKETGVTLFMVDEKVDHGKIIAQCTVHSENSDTYETLEIKLAKISGNLLIETLPKFLKGEIQSTVQNEAQATYTKKFTTRDTYVDLEKNDPVMIERKIRALNPEPGVWTKQNGKRVKLLEAELIEGKLCLKKIHVEGKLPQQMNN